MDFVSQHGINMASFYNTFIQHLGNNFNRISLHDLKLIPGFLMRVNLNQSDIFENIVIRAKTAPSRNKALLFQSIFHNGARLQM